MFFMAFYFHTIVVKPLEKNRRCFLKFFNDLHLQCTVWYRSCNLLYLYLRESDINFKNSTE